MTKAPLTVATCVTLLWAGTALAVPEAKPAVAPTPTAQQECDYVRIKAWGKYVSCVDGAAAKVAASINFDVNVAFAKCRHTYFRTWKAFQRRPWLGRLAGSICIGGQLTDNGTTVTDNLTGLTWEKKTTDGKVHDVNNIYSLVITQGGSPPLMENGDAFTTFLTGAGDGTDPETEGLNVAGFAGSNGWRVPTLAELQTTLKDFPCSGKWPDPPGTNPRCTCGTFPCIDATYGPTTFATGSGYCTATPGHALPSYGGYWSFEMGDADVGVNATYGYVRAVRGGL